MDTVDPEVAAICTNLVVVGKVFEVALFCSRGILLALTVRI
uniref:Uncharacterized protein n=1 Tax=Picea sitchensis TaxID=3332 RepID=D5AAE9_PICSI|nr:unknown [Picea sitchensis]